MAGIITLDLGNGAYTYFNGTPHAINLMVGATYDKDTRKHYDGSQVAAIPASGVMLSAKLETRPQVDLGMGITVAEQVVVDCDPLPECAKNADYIIVSAMYACAYRKKHGQDGVKLVTVRETVMSSETGKIIGCLGLALA